MFNQYDRVKSSKVLPTGGRRPLARGAEGTIVDIYKKGKAIGYHVEFTYRTGRTKALLMLSEEDIQPIEEPSEPAKLARKVIRLVPADVKPINRRTGAKAAGADALRSSGRGSSGKNKTVAKKAASNLVQKKKGAGKPAARKGKKYQYD